MGWLKHGKGQPTIESRPWLCEHGASRCRGMNVAVNGDVGTMVETVQEMISQTDIDGLSSGMVVPDARTSVEDALRKAGAAGASPEA